jgi:hypothetical protein
VSVPLLLPLPTGVGVSEADGPSNTFTPLVPGATHETFQAELDPVTVAAVNGTTAELLGVGEVVDEEVVEPEHPNRNSGIAETRPAPARNRTLRDLRGGRRRLPRSSLSFVLVIVGASPAKSS